AGVASGVNNAVSRATGVLAIAACGVVMLWVFSGALESRLNQRVLSDETRAAILSQRVRLAGIGVPEGLEGQARASVQDDIGRSFVSGFRTVMLVSAGCAVLSAVGAWLTIEDDRRSE